MANVDDPAWPSVQTNIADAPLPVEVLPVEPDQARAVLYRLQVTARSVLGAVALNCGGLLIDHGWLRILGGGGRGLPDLATVNGLGDPANTPGPPPYLTVAFDVFGGRFAIDGGGLGLQPGNVCYWAPDTLEWTDLGAGHGDFVAWVLTDGPTSFYADLRWPTWQDELAQLSPADGIAIYPPLFTAESRPIERTSRKPVPFDELLHFHQEAAAQIAGS